MSRCPIAGISVPVSFPRVSGDEPAASALGDLGAKFSPRERG